MADNNNIEHKNSIPWRKIPHEVKEDADELANYTADTGREGSITFCKKPNKDKIFVGNNFEGDFEHTEVLDCNAAFGKSKRIGTMHSHPSNVDTVGVLPSPGDLASSVDDAYKHGSQIDCITSPDTPLINCMSFNRQVTKQDKARYTRAFQKSPQGASEFFSDNVPKDFDFALFDIETGVREDEPPPKKVVKAAFGKSNRELRKDLKVFERRAYCNHAADLMGQGHREDVIEECMAELRRRSFLGLIDY